VLGGEASSGAGFVVITAVGSEGAASYLGRRPAARRESRPAWASLEKRTRRRAHRTTFAAAAPPESLAPVGSVRDFEGAPAPILAVPDASYEA